MIRQYPLEVMSVGEDTYIVMSRGHHDLQEFMREAVKRYPAWKLGGPVQVWCKTTPILGHLGVRYNFVPPGTRGAWPATYCHEHGDDWKRWNGLNQDSSDD